MRKHLRVLILTIVIPLMLTGCWGREELNTVAIIHTIAVDKEKNKNIRMTVEISDLVSEAQGPIGLRGKPVYLTSVGESIFVAARNLRNSSSRYLIWGHANAIIFSKDLAKEGIIKHFDVLLRLRHFRNSMNVFISDGKAADIFRASIPQQSFISIGMRGLVDAQKSTANTQRITIIEVFQTLTNQYNELTIPALQQFKLPNNDKESLQTLGLYSFKKDKLLAYMDANLTKAYLRSINKAKSTVEILPCTKNPKYITFENVHNHSKIISNLQGGQPRITIELHPEFNIVGVQCEEKITPEQLVKWETQLNAKLKQENQHLIDFTKKNNVDLLGIGEVIHREHPKEWKKLKKNWQQIYPHIQFQIEVKSRIEHSNLISKDKRIVEKVKNC